MINLGYYAEWREANFFSVSTWGLVDFQHKKRLAHFQPMTLATFLWLVSTMRDARLQFLDPWAEGRNFNCFRSQGSAISHKCIYYLHVLQKWLIWVIKPSEAKPIFVSVKVRVGRFPTVKKIDFHTFSQWHLQHFVWLVSTMRDARLQFLGPWA